MSAKRFTPAGESPEELDGTTTRAQFLRTAAGMGAGALLLGSLGAGPALARGRAAASGTLNVYSWPNYFSAGNLKAFKKQTGTSLNISTYEASDVLFAKLNTAAGAGFDIAVPTGGWIPEMVSKGLLQEIDHSKVSFKNIDKNLLNKVYDKGNKYSIPKDYGVAGVVYDPAAVGGTIKTWQDFFDAAAKPGVSGKVQLAASAYDVIGPGIWADGGDWNSTDPKVIKAGAARVKDIAKDVKEFSGFDSDGIVKGTIVLSYCDQALARVCILQNPKLKWVVPGPDLGAVGRQLRDHEERAAPRHGLPVPQLPAPAGPPDRGHRVPRLPDGAAGPALEARQEHEAEGADLRRRGPGPRQADLVRPEAADDEPVHAASQRDQGGGDRLARGARAPGTIQGWEAGQRAGSSASRHSYRSCGW